MTGAHLVPVGAAPRVARKIAMAIRRAVLAAVQATAIMAVAEVRVAHVRAVTSPAWAPRVTHRAAAFATMAN
jgi:hypothetical protein